MNEVHYEARPLSMPLHAKITIQLGIFFDVV